MGDAVARRPWVHFGLVIGAGVYHGVLMDPRLRQCEPREAVETAERVAHHIQYRLSFRPRLLRFHEADPDSIRDQLHELKQEIRDIRKSNPLIQASLFLFVSGRCDEQGHIRLYRRGQVLNDALLRRPLEELEVPVLAVFHSKRPDLFLVDRLQRPGRFGAVYYTDDPGFDIDDRVRSLLQITTAVSVKDLCRHMEKYPDLHVDPPVLSFDLFKSAEAL